jgi:hypothetical protein
LPSTSKELLGGQDAVAELTEPFGVIAHAVDCSSPSRDPDRGHPGDEHHADEVLKATALSGGDLLRSIRVRITKGRPVRTSIEAIRPGFAWNATRVASVLMIVIIAVIALVFWPSFETSDAEFPVTGQTNGLAAPHQPIVVNGEACTQCLP